MEQLEQLIEALRELSKTSGPVVDQASEALGLFVFLVQWSAIILSALAGLASARKHGMAFYGTLVIAFISAVGGGTVRDILLGRYPIFWLVEPVYVVSVLVVALISILIGGGAKRSKTAARVAQPIERLADDQSTAFIIIDSLALGLWAYLGTVYALLMGTPSIVAPVLGVITASFGAVIRDVFFARVPQMFMPGQLYALAAAVGAIVYVLLWGLGFGDTVGFLACFALTFIVRIASVKFNIQSY